MYSIPQGDLNTNSSISSKSGEYAYSTWHPQWGGYVGRCIVEFGTQGSHSDDFNCFEVYNWHDGEFPTTDPNEFVHFHYCCPEQLIEFAIVVMEKQMEHTKIVVGSRLTSRLNEFISIANSSFDGLSILKE